MSLFFVDDMENFFETHEAPSPDLDEEVFVEYLRAQREKRASLSDVHENKVSKSV